MTIEVVRQANRGQVSQLAAEFRASASMVSDVGRRADFEGRLERALALAQRPALAR